MGISRSRHNRKTTSLSSPSKFLSWFSFQKHTESFPLDHIYGGWRCLYLHSRCDWRPVGGLSQHNLLHLVIKFRVQRLFLHFLTLSVKNSPQPFDRSQINRLISEPRLSSVDETVICAVCFPGCCEAEAWLSFRGFCMLLSVICICGF